MTALIGQVILVALSALSAVGTYLGDFDKHHIFNSRWSDHARFHAAAYAILNIQLALLALVLCAFTPFGFRVSLQLGSVILLIMGITLFLAATVRGTSPIAGPHERIWAKVPLALWINVVYLGVLALGSWCALCG